MAVGIGTFLRRLRTARGVSLNQLARGAALAERTLRNWETGAHQPRLPELEAALEALDASMQERAQALALIDAPRGLRGLRAEPHILRLQEELGPIPSVGDLLRTIRQRRRLSLEQVAGELGVSCATLSRWENGKVVPPAEQRERLLTLLRAQPEERTALASGEMFGTTSLREVAYSPQALEYRFNQLRMRTFDYPQDALHDLSFLTFEALAWPLAAHGAVGRLLLGRIYANHATYLEAFDRVAESRDYAERALNLMSTQTVPEDAFVRAGIVTAHARVYQGRQPAPKRGIEMLELWLPHVQGLEYKAWLQSDMAEYVMLAGDVKGALALSAEACRVAADHEFAIELSHRRRDRAKLLLQADRIDEALALVTLEPGNTPVEHATVALLWAEGLMKQGDRSATEWLHRAYIQVQEHDLTHLRVKADAISRRL
jgi:transcriptional regulator with XRE-family HTH domain